MHLSTRHEFAAAPLTVAAMLRDPDFLRRVAARAGALEADVEASGVVATMSLTLKAPDKVAPLIGATLRFVQTTTWAAPTADGSLPHRIEVTVPGLPVTMYLDGVLRAEGAATVASYAGELVVRIPLMGKKIEQEAAPVVMHAFDAQAEVGRDWLAGDRAS